MKTILSSLFLLFCFALCKAQIPRFEGSVSYDVVSPQLNGAMTLQFGYPNVRMDLDLMGSSISIIQPASGGTMTVLMHDAQMWMTLPAGGFGLLGIRTQTQQAQTGQAPCGRCPIEQNATGKTRVILGYVCKQYRIPEATGDTLELWATSDLGGFNDYMPGIAPAPDMDRALSQAMFPLEMKRTTPAGDITTFIRATALSTKPVPASAMRPPAEYQKMSLDLSGGQ